MLARLGSQRGFINLLALDEGSWEGSIPSASTNAKIAQLVEHRSEESGVVGSIPTLGTKQCPSGAIGRRGSLKRSVFPVRVGGGVP